MKIGISPKSLMWLCILLGIFFFPFWIIAAIIWVGLKKEGEKE